MITAAAYMGAEPGEFTAARAHMPRRGVARGAVLATVRELSARVAQ
jgi:hypothetical protein